MLLCRMHTGDIIAGCIGTKQLRYDIWGENCLVANSMESNGIPSGIVVSRKTAEYVLSTTSLLAVCSDNLALLIDLQFDTE
jgi:class 3 adenylate cyclase